MSRLRRVTVALEDLWPYLDELFQDEPLIDRLDGDRGSSQRRSREPVQDAVADILKQCELSAPTVAMASGGGRRGRHSSYLGYLLAEMQVLARQHPGATW